MRLERLAGCCVRRAPFPLYRPQKRPLTVGGFTRRRCQAKQSDLVATSNLTLPCEIACWRTRLFLCFFSLRGFCRKKLKRCKREPDSWVQDEFIDHDVPSPSSEMFIARYSRRPGVVRRGGMKL